MQLTYNLSTIAYGLRAKAKVIDDAGNWSRENKGSKEESNKRDSSEQSDDDQTGIPVLSHTLFNVMRREE